jgi:two-component system nitrate/nitrite response regulator NarL
MQQMHVDVVLLDFDLGERDGIDFMRRAKEQGFTGRVLVVTAGVDQSKVAELIHTGISGIFMKHNSAASLPQGIRDVMSGKVWFDQELLQDAITGQSKRRAKSDLTQRERQVLSYVFEGLANKQIAEKIGVSESSVKATLQQLFSKTGVHTRSQLVRIVLEHYKDQI